ncbi:hypothetical protein TKK_0018856 [Trichogramma kaykai]
MQLESSNLVIHLFSVIRKKKFYTTKNVQYDGVLDELKQRVELKNDAAVDAYIKHQVDLMANDGNLKFPGEYEMRMPYIFDSTLYINMHKVVASDVRRMRRSGPSSARFGADSITVRYPVVLPNIRIKFGLAKFKVLGVPTSVNTAYIDVRKMSVMVESTARITKNECNISFTFDPIRVSNVKIGGTVLATFAGIDEPVFKRTPALINEALTRKYKEYGDYLCQSLKKN